MTKQPTGHVLPFDAKEQAVRDPTPLPSPPALVARPPEDPAKPAQLTVGQEQLLRRAKKLPEVDPPPVPAILPPVSPDKAPVAKGVARAVVKPIAKDKATSASAASKDKPATGDGPPKNASAASDAAADARPPAQPVTAPAAELHSSSKRPAVPVELVWVDAAHLDAVRARPGWKEIVASIKPKPRDADFTEGAPPDKQKEAKNRLELTGLLARGEPSTPDELRHAMADAVDDDGTFVPPLVLLSGEMVFPFDELQTLKATIAAVTPFAAADKKLKEIVDTVGEAMQTPWLQGAGRVAEGLTAQVLEAFGESRRGLPAGYLEAHTERILLEQRHYQKRTVMGQPWIRGLFSQPGAGAAVPAYLPVSLANELPMYQRLSVRLIAEARMQLDQYESAPIALRVVALGRALAGAARF